MSYRNNKVVDIVYRTLLWGVIAYAMCSLSETLGPSAGRFFKEALAIKPNVNWASFIAMAGMIVAPIVWILKDFEFFLFSQERRFLPVTETVYWMSKLSSDLILIGYGMMSFVLGWCVYLFINHNPGTDEYLMLGISMPFFLLNMFFLALASLAVRSEVNGRLFGWWRRQLPAVGRVAVCGLFILVFSTIAWVQN